MAGWPTQTDRARQPTHRVCLKRWETTAWLGRFLPVRDETCLLDRCAADLRRLQVVARREDAPLVHLSQDLRPECYSLLHLQLGDIHERVRQDEEASSAMKASGR